MYKDVILNSRCHVVIDDGNEGIWVVFLVLCYSSKDPSEAWLWYLKGERCFLCCWLSPVLSPWRHEGFQCFSPCCCKTHAAISTALPRYSTYYGLYSSKLSVVIVYTYNFDLAVPSVLGFCEVKKFKIKISHKMFAIQNILKILQYLHKILQYLHTELWLACSSLHIFNHFTYK